ncbi:glyoxalase/bleomycin resistance/dioxygenase family protein [Dictyobacter sp. S3.2.2.5]|uniref:Glyoxalase/bleomycin resistance/dioxygenase family protein n=1 Tax=Dictyobacter halimunensis TaxID=3026934 RepID=A0ABQ6FM67_9CHLR|nr:glyoxalase/bleomycin resistance/dioxygenase family protein [Dictyobacter sp. S3.2.2.5]
MINRIVATVVFVRDLATSMAFYRDTLGLKMTFSDAVSATFQLGDLYFLLLDVSSAAELIGVNVSELKADGGPRGLFAAGVEDVDAAYEAFKARGVTFLKPPIDQHWGLRTAHFADPEGNVWEINQPVEAKSKG